MRNTKSKSGSYSFVEDPKMDFNTLTYDACRHYVTDNSGTLGPENSELILGWIRSRNLKSLVSCCSLIPSALQDGTMFSILRQIEAFFKKNAIFAEPISCERNALLSFDRAERICRITNRRLDYYFCKRDRLDPDLASLVEKASRYIEMVLGDHRIFLEELPRRVRFTSGATASSSRRNSRPHQKIKLRMRASAGSDPYLCSLSKWFGYSGLRTVHQSYNRVEIVPKNWKTARTIACEPEGNIPLQLAFDGYAKDRLRRFGIDLSDQSRSQRLAYEGSIDGSYATLDLSMASDTVSFNTVAWLFPKPWFDFLNRTRSQYATGRFGIRKYAKFSSMGNGATFCIETLIFAALCHASGSRHFAVYGDDIAIEPQFVDTLMRGLRFFGFSLNLDKSFTSGPFRESCGADWFEGKNVTPFYIRKWSGLKAQFCHNVNGLASVALPGQALWRFLLNIVKEMKLPLVPFSEDTMSGVFVDVPTSYALGLIKTKHQIAKYRAYKPVMPQFNVYDSRTLFLWYHDRYRMKTIIGKDALIRSRVPAFVHRYVRKWVHWTVPVVGAPVYLYWWTEDLTR